MTDQCGYGPLLNLVDRLVRPPIISKSRSKEWKRIGVLLVAKRIPGTIGLGVVTQRGTIKATLGRWEFWANLYDPREAF